MREVIVIGCGVSGLACAVRCAEQGLHVTLVSPHPSERSQSVMAAGGINAVLATPEPGDSVESHIEDTLRGGCHLAGTRAVTGLCEGAADVIAYLERIGTVFTVDSAGRPQRRAFGGQSHKRTYYCGSSTGKQIVSALVMEARRHEATGAIERRLWRYFHSALIRDGACHGALFLNEVTGELEAAYADALVVATGGQNALFGKTTGSTQCDGYVAGRLFLQGAVLKNLEFIQYHPTTLETPQKRMLVSEAARGEGGRLFYVEGGRRAYFMEDAYGPEGNLQTRDVVSRAIDALGREVFLDVSGVGARRIAERLPEVRDLCAKYRGIDICTEPIPVAPSVHFFMGGLAVRETHETSIRNLFAVGECASMYHGANRLGGNSLLAAIYGGQVAAATIAGREALAPAPDFGRHIERERSGLRRQMETESPFPAMYLRDMLAETMQRHLGIVRDEASLATGRDEVDYYLSIADRIRYDKSVSPYATYSLAGILAVAKATFACALARQESRGAHYRADYPQMSDRLAHATLISYNDGAFDVEFDERRAYES